MAQLKWSSPISTTRFEKRAHIYYDECGIHKYDPNIIKGWVEHDLSTILLR